MKIRAAGKFFSYLAKHFPVMCASGAFPLLPPVTDAASHLDKLDDLSAKSIAKHLAKLTRFKKDFVALEGKATTFEERAAARALALCASGVVTELGGIRTWEKGPELYLQIAFTGIEQTVSMPAKSEKLRQKRFLKRLKAVPALLGLASDNIEAISPSSRAAAQTMVRDCARYLTELGESELGKVGKGPRFLADILTALRDFDRFVTSRPEVPESEGPSFAVMAESVFGTDKSPQEIYAMAEAEYAHRLESLRWLASEISPGSDWEAVSHGYVGPDDEGMEANDLIVREIHRLRSFMLETALPGVFNDTPLRIETQPVHLASSLRPIHYDPSLGAWENDSSRCFVSPQIFSGRGFRDNPMRLARRRQEFVFMAARQTYPGRHLIDSQRRVLADSPLGQISNPLFMAGWFAFAENLLDELGYFESPMDRLVHHKRGLRRAALAMIDAGLAVGNMDQDRCLSILGEAGYSREESLENVRSIRLKPAERVMPILGLAELTALRKAANMDIGPFCTRLFADGQLPFSLIAERMGV